MNFIFYLNMSKFIELMKIENKIEKRNVSTFIINSFEIKKKTFNFISMPLTLSFVYTCSWFVAMQFYL